MLARMDPDVRRRATRLLLGILVCGVVIALCVVLLVVIVDRFTAPVADDCRRTDCRSGAAAVRG